ncbi:hypothetical protein [Actinocatenispora comari]|uniref:Uncharacterized protein n=1 Tax=Actinocatenispora comari TaxID=2807577 RepID=A0A8J4EL86_9ACTN|nr:hypothetical protein [Actinocatenispora comari]GIL29017.1 hypothetical protein NUM_42710 [Actinocatenispora comari]
MSIASTLIHNTLFTSLLTGVIGFGVKAWWDSRSKKKQRAQQLHEEDQRHFRDKRLDLAMDFIVKARRIGDPLGYEHITDLLDYMKAAPKPDEVRQAKIERANAALESLTVLKMLCPSLGDPGHELVMAFVKDQKDSHTHLDIFAEHVRKELGEESRRTVMS